MVALAPSPDLPDHATSTFAVGVRFFSSIPQQQALSIFWCCGRSLPVGHRWWCTHAALRLFLRRASPCTPTTIARPRRQATTQTEKSAIGSHILPVHIQSPSFLPPNPFLALPSSACCAPNRRRRWVAPPRLSVRRALPHHTTYTQKTTGALPFLRQHPSTTVHSPSSPSTTAVLYPLRYQLARYLRPPQHNLAVRSPASFPRPSKLALHGVAPRPLLRARDGGRLVRLPQRRHLVVERVVRVRGRLCMVWIVLSCVRIRTGVGLGSGGFRRRQSFVPAGRNESRQAVRQGDAPGGPGWRAARCGSGAPATTCP